MKHLNLEEKLLEDLKKNKNQVKTQTGTQHFISEKNIKSLKETFLDLIHEQAQEVIIKNKLEQKLTTLNKPSKKNIEGFTMVINKNQTSLIYDLKSGKRNQYIYQINSGILFLNNKAATKKQLNTFLSFTKNIFRMVSKKLTENSFVKKDK
tara:strand:+ start:1132 stop:1584 length:453 start_codon:yes stop_codon:yes gene_type:complete